MCTFIIYINLILSIIIIPYFTFIIYIFHILSMIIIFFKCFFTKTYFAGVQSHGCTHSCYACSGSKIDDNGNKNAKFGRWRRGEDRTLEFNLDQHQKWKEATALAGLSPIDEEARNALPAYFNCHVPPLNLHKDKKKPIFLYCPMDPLHVCKV